VKTLVAHPLVAPCSVSIVGHFGEDRTVIATRAGDVVIKLESWAKHDTVQVAALCEQRAARTVRPSIVVDGIGVGAGVVGKQPVGVDPRLVCRGASAYLLRPERGTAKVAGNGVHGRPITRFQRKKSVSRADQFLLPGGDVIGEQLRAYAKEPHRMPVAAELEARVGLDLHHDHGLDRRVLDRFGAGQPKPAAR